MMEFIKKDKILDCKKTPIFVPKNNFSANTT